MIEQILIRAVAGKLLDKYLNLGKQNKVDLDQLLSPDKLGESITTLLEQNLIDFQGKTLLMEFTPTLVTHVFNSIKHLQKTTGGQLKPDGILGASMFKWITNRPFGHFPKRVLNQSNTSSTPQNNTIRYFIEKGHFKNLKGLSENIAIQRFSEAWASWSKACHLKVDHTGERSNANVVVTVQMLRGQSPSVLAIADVGPPGKQQLEIQFDKAETWTAERFQSAAAHEIGHLLGLHHLSAKDSLMNDTLHPGIMTPQAADKKAAREIWGEAPY